MTEINVKIKLTDDVKTAIDNYVFDLEETSEEFIESRVEDLILKIAKEAIIDAFDNQVKSGKVFGVTVESSGVDNENG